MKKFIIALAVTLSVLLIGIAAVGFFLPTDYQVSRTQLIAKQARAVHLYVDDLHNWQAWEPWTEADPSLAITVGEPSSGVDASWTCTSGENHGVLTITSSDPDAGVSWNMDYNDGQWTARNAMTWATASGNDEHTEVTWTVTGEVPVPIVGGYLALMMDGMLGPHLAHGLERLKLAAESVKQLKIHHEGKGFTTTLE